MAVIPSSGKDRNWVAVLRRTMSAAWWGNDVRNIDQAPIALHNEPLLVVNEAGTGYVEVLRVGPGNRIMMGDQPKIIKFESRSVGTSSGRRFWISDGDYTIVGIQEVHATAETTAATMTASVQKVSAAGVAQNLLLTGLNMKATANVVQTAAINTTTPGVLSITTGDQFNWTTSVAGTELAGVVLEVYLMPGQRNNQVNHYFANNGAIDSVFYLATRPMVITRIDYTHASAASGTCTFQVEIESGTTAPGAGSTAVLTTPFDCQGTALVIQNGVLSANTRLNPGDRLSMDFTGTTTGLAGGQLTVTFAPYDDRKDIVFNAPLNANNQDAPFFIADRSYEIVAASAIWSTAATAGANAQLTVCSGTQDAASGLDIIANDTNAGFQIDGTANTVEVGTFIAGRNFLFAGDRLGIDYTVTTSILGLNITVTLRPA